jgi:hypothetical protein
MPGSQGDFELLRSDHRVVEKHLVKIAEPKEKQSPGMLALDFLILPEHWSGWLHSVVSRARLAAAKLEGTHDPRVRSSRVEVRQVVFGHWQNI